MNRKERRAVAKQLGLHKHFNKMSREERLQKMRDNQENGRRLEEEMRRSVTESLQAQDDERISRIIEHKAENIAKEKGIPLMDAIELAKEEYNK